MLAVRRLFIRSGVVAVALLVVVSPAWAIVAGQVDDFEDGTLKNWANGGNGAPLVSNIATGGPAGANDNFMQVTSDGSGPGTFLTVFNRSQWLGNYHRGGSGRDRGRSAKSRHGRSQHLPGVQAGHRPRCTGIYFRRPVFSRQSEAGGSMQLSLSIRQTWIRSTRHCDFNTFFSGSFAEMRFINSAGADSLNGDVTAGQLGIDNIRAVPEPGAFILTSIGLLGIFVRRARRL